MKAVNDRLIIKPKEKDDMTDGGILLPTNDNEAPVQGVVMSVGNGKVLPNGERSKMMFEVGQNLLFSKFSGSEIKHKGENYLVIREDDVIAILGE